MSFPELFHCRRLEVTRSMLPSDQSSFASLDVGSGSPGLLNQLGYCNVVCVDAHRRDSVNPWPNVNVQASGDYLPFRDQSFQMVYGGEVLEHLDQPAKALTDWTRVLKSGGTIGLSTPNGVLVGLEGNRLDHKHVFTLDDLKRALEVRGITALRTRTIFTGLVSGRRIFQLLPLKRLMRVLLKIPVPASLSYDLCLVGVKK